MQKGLVRVLVGVMYGGGMYLAARDGDWRWAVAIAICGVLVWLLERILSAVERNGDD